MGRNSGGVNKISQQDAKAAVLKSYRQVMATFNKGQEVSYVKFDSAVSNLSKRSAGQLANQIHSELTKITGKYGSTGYPNKKLHQKALTMDKMWQKLLKHQYA